MSEKTPKELRWLFARAIELCAHYVPADHRNPTPGGGNVLTTAVGVLVAGRALVEAFIEHEEKGG